jgi:polar amino acid transport system substrate-binding protein
MIDTGIFFTAERAKIMQMIPYENNAISISVAKGNPGNIAKIEDLAGKGIGVEIGGFEEKQAKALAAKVKDAGLAEPTVRTFDNFSTAFQALRAGQVDAVVTIDATAKEYQDRGDFTRVLNGLSPTPVALAVKSRPLAEAVKAVLDGMKADGSYQKLFERYGLTPFPGDTFEIKGPAT